MIESALTVAVRGEPLLDLLTAVLRWRMQTGESQGVLLDELERLRAALRSDDRDDEEDIVLEAMDFLTGFCSPHMCLR